MQTIPVTSTDGRCSTCMLSELCLPLGLARADIEKLDTLVQERIRIPKGKTLFRLGDAGQAIYALRFGSIKTQVEDVGGQVQITGFLLPGELLGMNSLVDARQRAHAIALEDSEVCVMPLAALDTLLAQLPALQQKFRRLMMQEIDRSHNLILLLGSLRAERRLATFLLDLSRRFAALGYSPSTFILRMGREDIGNHLSLTIETVSRLFTRFGKEGLIRVRNREVQLLDVPALQTLSGLEWPRPCQQ